MTFRTAYVFLAASLILAAASTLAPAAEMFTSAEGRFSVQLPAKPTVEDVAIDENTTQRQFMVERDDCAILISYQDNPGLAQADAATLDRALLTAQNATRDSFNGKVVHQQAIRLHKVHPGREATVTIPAAGGVARVRVFLVRGRLYQLMVIGEMDAVDREAPGVFDTFSLTR